MTFFKQFKIDKVCHLYIYIYMYKRRIKLYTE